MFRMIGFVLMAMLMMPVVGNAQEEPADNMEIVMEKLKADKKLFIADYMGLTEAEAKGFWPVYDEYQKRLRKIMEDKVNLIGDFADHFHDMTDEAARKILKDALFIGERLQTLKRAFVPRFQEVISDIKVARYYQLENKIQAVVNFQIARQIPLVK